MRRSLLLSAVFGVLAGGVGCKAVGGRCDCQGGVHDSQMPAPGMAYPTIGGPVGGVGAMSVAPAAVAPIPSPEKMPAPITPPAGK